MSSSLWMLVAILAMVAFEMIILGLFAGDAIQSYKFFWVLD